MCTISTPPVIWQQSGGTVQAEPVRLSMDAASFPVAAKDMANLRGRKVGVPYLPTLPPRKGGKAGLCKDYDRSRSAVNLCKRRLPHESGTA